MSLSISKFDIARIYISIFTLVFFSIYDAELLLFLPLGILSYGYWYSVTTKNSSHLLKAIKIIGYLYIPLFIFLIWGTVINVLDLSNPSIFLDDNDRLELRSEYIWSALTILVGVFLFFKFLLFAPIIKNIEFITKFGIFKNLLIPSSKITHTDFESNDLNYWFLLYEKGAITKEEYEIKKAFILDSKNNSN